jgi:DNA-binding transcriptional LysR family regulator
MELRQLEYFTAVVRHGHFGRAAQDVYVTQSALSQQIARLEDELGLTLLIRSTKGVELTPAGTEFLAHARAILEQVAEARAAIDDHLGAVRGVARVAATPYDAPVLPAALVAFHRAWPGLQLALRHGSAAQVLELLSAGAVDIAVLAVHDGEPAVPAGIATRFIASEPLALVCAPRSPLAGRTDAGFEALRGVPVIMPERGTALRALISAGCEAAGFSPLPFFETSDPGTVRELAAAGLGVGVVPRSWSADAEGSSIVTVAFTEPAPVYRVALLAGTAGRLPVRDLLVDHLTRCFESAARA